MQRPAALARLLSLSVSAAVTPLPAAARCGPSSLRRLGPQRCERGGDRTDSAQGRLLGALLLITRRQEKKKSEIEKLLTTVENKFIDHENCG